MLTKKWFTRRLREFRVEHDDCRRDVCSIQTELDEIVSRYADILAQAVKDAEREKAERLVTWLDGQRQNVRQEYPTPGDAWASGYRAALREVQGHVRNEFLARFDRNGRPL